MALELISETSEAATLKRKKRSAKARKPVTAGVVIRIDAWKKQRPTRGRATESETVIVNARGSWIDGLVGLFDNSPTYAEVLRQEQEARRRMDNEPFVMPE